MRVPPARYAFRCVRRYRSSRYRTHRCRCRRTTGVESRYSSAARCDPPFVYGRQLDFHPRVIILSDNKTTCALHATAYLAHRTVTTQYNPNRRGSRRRLRLFPSFPAVDLSEKIVVSITDSFSRRVDNNAELSSRIDTTSKFDYNSSCTREGEIIIRVVLDA